MNTSHTSVIPIIFALLLMLLTPIRYGFADDPKPISSIALPDKPINLPENKISLAREIVPQGSIPPDRTGNWFIDTNDRQLSRAFFNSVHQSSSAIAHGWSGDLASCSPGTTSDDFQNGVLARVNYFRAMAGVPSDISFDNVFNRKAQQLALMMSRNYGITHYPPSSWLCYTNDGAQAAASSTLFLDTYGWEAISAQMSDNGTYNGGVTNRRWLLYPQTRLMGLGNVPPTPGYSAAHVLWILDGKYGTARPVTREWYVAWPPPGYVPYPVVPARWSFSYDADFSSATVSMSSGGVSIPVTVHPVETNYGENTIAWDIDGLDANQWNAQWPAPLEDTTYTVSINNMEDNGVMLSYSYQVTVFDPSTPGESEEYSTISGLLNPEVGMVETYTFNPVSIAEGYEVLAARFNEGNYFEGGENGLTAIIDNSDPVYDLLTSTSSMTGAYAMHLTHPNYDDNSFEIDRSFVPSATSTIDFQSRLGYATTNQQFQVQLSVDNAQSWNTIYSSTGTGGPGQSQFTQNTVSLSEYADSIVRLRFAYIYNGGNLYDCTEDHCGVLVDDVQLSNAKELTDTGILPLGQNLGFTFKSPDQSEFLFAVRSVPWDGYPELQWGPIFKVNPVPNIVELRDAVKMLNALSDGFIHYTLADVIAILGVLTGS